MNVLEPSRAQYRKNKDKVKICQFCDPEVLAEQEVKTLAGKYWRVIANRYPYMDGNVMLAPLRHICQLEEMTADEKNEFFEILFKSKKALAAIFETDSFNCGINIGEHSGCSINHLHWQLIPRRKYTQNCTNIIHDLHIITMDYKELIDKLDNPK